MASDAREALLDQVAELLLEAARVECVRQERAQPPSPGRFGADAVISLTRHGSPLRTLLTVLEDRELALDASDPRLEVLRALSNDQLTRAWENLRRRGMELLAARTQFAPRTSQPSPQVRVDVCATAAKNAASERHAATLEKTLDRWFAPPQSGHHFVDGEPDDTAALVWYEVTSVGNGALALSVVLAPIGDLLPPMARTLTLCAGALRRAVQRQNASRLGARIALPPSANAVTWTVGELDEDLASELARLALEALSSERATAFRADIEGRAQCMASTTLAAGRSYRLVIPRPVAWEIREVVLPKEVPAVLREELAAMGLSVGAAEVSATWVGAPPREYRQSSKGERYACFEPGEALTICVDAGRAVTTGEMAVFVVRGGFIEHTLLPAGERWTLALEGLDDGRYVFAASHEDRALAPARLVFEVLAEPLPERAVEMALLCSGRRIEPGARAEMDLSAQGTLEVISPAGMDVSLRWRGAQSWREPGWSEGVESRLAGSVEHSRVGLLTADFGEWGVATIEHETRWSPPRAETLRSTWRELLRDGLSLRAMAVTNPQLFATAWVQRAVEALGYATTQGLWPETDHSQQQGPLLLHAAAWKLRADRHRGGRFGLSYERLMVVTGEDIDRTKWADSPLQLELITLVEFYGWQEIVLTDMARWWRVDPRRPRLGAPMVLGELLDDTETMGDFFLGPIGAWR